MSLRVESGFDDASIFGLKPLHGSNERRNFKATIVAVHGLTGHYRYTWSNEEASPPFFWIQDGLGLDLPECRLLSYGYDAWVISAPKEHAVTLIDHAKDLLYQLECYLEKEAKSSPIIFIAHNIGGILVKQVLIQSAHSARSEVHKCTAAILFFGTPHHGSSLNSFTETILNVSKIAGMKPNTSLIESLSEDSAILQSTNESWLHLQQKYEIYSFYETHASRFGMQRGIIVNKHDATLNEPRERVIALDGTHSSMIKPSSKDSEIYTIVVSHLRNLVQHLSQTPPIARPPRSPTSLAGAASITFPKSIDFKGYVHVFKENSLHMTRECSLSDAMAEIPTVLQENPEDDLQSLVWVHFPLNHTAWVSPCLHKIVSNQNKEQGLSITEQRYWLCNERKRQYVPHSRHFEPSSFISRHESSIQFVIYLPYLHWDSTKCFTRRADYLKAIQSGKLVDIPDDLSDQGRAIYKIMKDDRGEASSFHPRRSLDQFFYTNLSDTSSRDKDQVVSKNTSKGARGGRKMIMVDQLWLWLLEAAPHRQSPHIQTTIFTSFARKECESRAGDKDLDELADLRQAIIDEANSMDNKWAANRSNYVGLIIEQAVNVMLSVRTEQSLDFLSVFRAAIGEAMEAQSAFFRLFQEKMKSNSYEIIDSQTKRGEVQLALEISDIVDELNSINRLFEAQKDALATAIKILPSFDSESFAFGRYEILIGRLKYIIREDIERYITQVKRLISDAERTKDSLKDLLDLQQKEETLREAHYSNEQADAAREQANATAAQSQILLLFTVVTIVFAPLSFFTSYFGMNVREFTGDDGNTNQRIVWRVMGPLSVAIIFSLLGGAWYMYKQTQREQKNRKTGLKAKSK